MEGIEPANGEKVPPPPYISFRTILNLIERMADEEIPPRIDRSYLRSLSGGQDFGPAPGASRPRSIRHEGTEEIEQGPR